MLLRFLLIISIIIYVFYKIGAFFFRAGAASQQLRDYQEKEKKAAAANKAKVKAGKTSGGEYIDFEEVK